MLQVCPGPAGLAGRPCLLQHDHKHAGAAACSRTGGYIYELQGTLAPIRVSQDLKCPASIPAPIRTVLASWEHPDHFFLESSRPDFGPRVWPIFVRDLETHLLYSS